MIWFAVRTLVGTVVLMAVACAAMFLVFDLVPANPARLMLGPDASPAALTELNRQLLLDKPPVERLGAWLLHGLTGDFGRSVSQGAPAGSLVASRLLVSVPLLLLSALVAAGMGVGLGAVGSSRRSALRWIARPIAVVVAAVPPFWLGMLLSLALAAGLHLLPSGGFVPWDEEPLGALSSLILPALALGLPVGGLLALRVAAAIREMRASPYMRAALTRGLTVKEAFRQHGMRNVAVALARSVGPAIATLLAGGLIVETVFYLPGLGRLVLDAAVAHDIVLVRAALAIIFAGLAFAVLAGRLTRGFADPRLRHRAAS